MLWTCVDRRCGAVWMSTVELKCDACPCRWQSMWRVPWFCHLGNGLVLLLQLHWFQLMVRGAARVLRSGDARHDTKEE